MKTRMRAGLFLVGAVLAVFVAVKMVYEPFITRQVIGLFGAEAQRMDAFNDVGRLEAYDSLRDFLDRGCIDEAKRLVALQQSLLLSGIAHGMGNSESVVKVVLDRNAAVAERARLEALNRNPPRTVPMCP
jgi:hypothetical protein